MPKISILQIEILDEQSTSSSYILFCSVCFLLQPVIVTRCQTNVTLTTICINLLDMVVAV